MSSTGTEARIGARRGPLPGDVAGPEGDAVAPAVVVVPDVFGMYVDLRDLVDWLAARPAPTVGWASSGSAWAAVPLWSSAPGTGSTPRMGLASRAVAQTPADGARLWKASEDLGGVECAWG